ncbi:MAG: Molybdenum transport ATP-binding protein ModC (TC 3.A.1.8.1) [uncultured Sulfurovum sp.]|uniref:Molybdenum transport ATP-binding protein ModC (TC 3.A.1.8.1) n=1 Tax=uncultured Sulfurovum sp. TaxID=269237 RepID=A0A6S6SU10_9BACT|nr:MAG: Molybdenum transport ATP-binding protein ModC (TC 3.A.1.8.1) [uncultured Sulfurovum sp.]
MVNIAIQKPLFGAKGQMALSVDIEVERGEFVAIMGESGSGKTTLLRVVAGLETSSGDIIVEGNTWKGVPPQQREIGFIFQDYALFDNMTVEENLLFVKSDKSLANELLEMTHIVALKSRNVKSLSGGQKQRVALCRAMMRQPKILLMDEPLSAIDKEMRHKLRADIKALHTRFGMTTIMVSHDIGDVFALATRVIRLDQGKVISDASVRETFLHTNKESHLKLQGSIIDIMPQERTAIVSVGEQLIEVLLSKEESQKLNVGDSFFVHVTS